MNQIEISLLIMGKGMLGIFIVMILIMLIIQLLGKLTGKEKKDGSAPAASAEETEDTLG